MNRSSLTSILFFPNGLKPPHRKLSLLPGTAKNPLSNGCFNWMIPNYYMKNGCFIKHQFKKTGGLGYQAFFVFLVKCQVIFTPPPKKKKNNTTTTRKVGKKISIHHFQDVNWQISTDLKMNKIYINSCVPANHVSGVYTTMFFGFVFHAESPWNPSLWWRELGWPFLFLQLRATYNLGGLCSGVQICFPTGDFL